MRARSRWVVTALVGLLWVVGCSSDDDDNGGAGAAGAAGSAGTGGTAQGGTGGVLSGGSGGGAGEAGSGGGGEQCPGVGQALGFDAACSECLSASCCTEATACQKSNDCTAMLNCALECEITETGPETTCLQACAGEHPDGIGGYNAVVFCLGQECDACPF
jgi:hypothetical protein